MKHGLASYLSDEELILEKQLAEFPDEKIKMSEDEINVALNNPEIKKSYRFALYNSYRMVRTLVAGTGRDKMVETIRLLGEGSGPADAFQTAYGESWDDLLARVQSFKVNQ